MNDLLNENQLAIVSKYDFMKPFIHKSYSIIDKCIRDCHKKYSDTFE